MRSKYLETKRENKVSRFERSLPFIVTALRLIVILVLIGVTAKSCEWLAMNASDSQYFFNSRS